MLNQIIKSGKLEEVNLPTYSEILPVFQANNVSPSEFIYAELHYSDSKILENYGIILDQDQFFYCFVHKNLFDLGLNNAMMFYRKGRFFNL